MSKKNNAFKNRAARRFNDITKVDVMSEDEIYSIFDNDLKDILGQFTDFRERKPRAQYPAYVFNAFANISTAKYFAEYVDKHVKLKKHGKVIKTDLDEAEIDSLRDIISDAYKKSKSNFYANQLQEFVPRNKYLSKTFIKLYPIVYKMTGKLDGLSKSERRDLTIQIYGKPSYNMRQIHKIINESISPDKKKLKILRKMYGKDRFYEAVGAAMTVEGNNSDCLAMLFDYMVKLKPKKRALCLKAYAEAYKRTKTRYFRIDKDFYDKKKNKEIIKALGEIDEGFKKAFSDLKSTNKAHARRRDDKRKVNK